MSPSILLHNGAIYPLNGIVQKADAISIRNGIIARLGTNERVKESAENPDIVIDLKGKPVFPAFVDNLSFLSREISARRTMDLSAIRNIPEIFALVEQKARSLEHGCWIVGYGWNNTLWGWQRFPHRADLDLVAPHHPVVLFGSDGRVAWLNSAATQQLGVCQTTPNPRGGQIERDPITRSFTGILKEKAVQLIPKNIHRLENEILSEALGELAREYYSMGVVSVCAFEELDMCQKLSEIGARMALPLEIVCHARYEDWNRFEETGWTTGQLKGGVRQAGVWMPVDGTLLAQTAWMLEPYVVNWNQYGIEVANPDEVKEMTAWCQGKSYSPIYYASGDGAVRTTLDALASCRWSKRYPRPFIVNGDLLDLEDQEKISRPNPGLLTNPRRLQSENEIGRRLWGSRWSRALDLKCWKDHGALLHFGSGEPIAHWSPIKALAAAIGGENRADSLAATKLNLGEALVAMTQPMMLTQNMNASTGLLTTGQPANLVILSEDPYALGKDKIGDIQTQMTLFRGDVVYDPDNLAG